MGDYRKLKAMLHDELDRIADKDELNPSSLDMVDKLAHALKCIATVEAMEDAGYSEHDGMSYGRRYAKRDSMGRYSSESRYPDYDRRY
ncbi:MAG: hypothetical protein IKX20_07785 [Paludibacteraceae bacterium]|nr:hypothetical protein [Paludibacteraceae bacterium]